MLEEEGKESCSFISPEAQRCSSSAPEGGASGPLEVLDEEVHVEVGGLA